MKHVSRRRRHTRISAVAILLLALGAVSAYAARGRIEESVAPPAPGATPPPAEAELTTEESDFYRFVGPRLGVLSAESAKLAELGEARTRDLLELQVRANRIDDVSRQIDGYVATRAVPPRFQPVIDRYDAAITDARQGIDATEAAFRRFDWDGVAAGLAVFERGARGLDDAYSTIRAAAGDDRSTPDASSVAAIAARLRK